MRATTPTPACPQVTDPRLDQVLGNLLEILTYSEDCLRLSLTLPADYQPGEQLPVLVWVHEGSYITGTGYLIYDPATLVRTSSGWCLWPSRSALAYCVF